LRYGKFQRQIPLPAHIQSDKAQAEYKNGMLTLTLPKAEGEQKKVVKVNVN
jgi:HSP20 family protein